MQTTLAPRFSGTSQGEAAADILRDCVHCGFCTATCPTYQLLGDELDGPRGRIYLIKSVLEGAVPTASTQLHLDRCLSCRACETACPSGVRYGELLDIGRQVVDAQVQRPWRDRVQRAGLRNLTTGRLFAPLLALGRFIRPWLSSGLQAKVPPLPAPGERGAKPGARHATQPVRAATRQMLLLRGCVQPAIAPQIQQATRAVFASLGIELIVAPEARCCGAVRQHLGDPAGALVDARRNIDAWWPHIEAGIEAIVVDASGCGIAVADYGHLLRDDASYSAKAKRVSALYRDPVQVMGASAVELKSAIDSVESARIAFHPPCTLQHGLKLPRAVESLLGQLGYELLPLVGAPMCCGSAGTYSMMQPEIATELRARRLEVLLEGHPEIILSANVGCITHLAAASPVPVQHWLEFIAARLVPTSKEMR